MGDGLGRLLDTITAQDRVEQRVAGGDLFVSGWDTTHPFAADMVGELFDDPAAELRRLTAYTRIEDDPVLADRLGDLHAGYGEPRPATKQFVPGGGASGFLASLLHFVRQLGHGELCYVPPVYYNATYWIYQIGFAVERVCASTPIGGADVALALPPRRTCLWLTDPLWFAGVAQPAEVYDQIQAWQARTGSTVIVDGTFAYMEWAGPQPAPSSELDPSLTYRLVCPTKALALHGFRFAYAVAPLGAVADYAQYHARMHGAASRTDAAFAHRAVELLATRMPSATLWPYVADRHRLLVDHGVLSRDIAPTSGYFAFAQRHGRREDEAAFGSDCFDVAGHPDHVRVNLLDDAVFARLTEYIRTS